MISIRLSHSAALVAIVFVGGCANALAADVSLDNLTFATKDGGSAMIKHVEFDGTNLSKDEVTALFSATSTRETRAPIIAKMQATKILVPEVVFIDKDKAGTITFHEFQATGVNAGKVEHMTLTGFDGSGTAADVPGQMTLHSGAIGIDGGDFSKLLLALRDGDLTNAGTSQINHFSWQGFSLTVPDKDTPTTAAGGNLYKIALASLVGQATYSADLPATASGELKDLTIEPPKASEFGQQLAAFGYDKIDLGFTASGSYDAAKKTYALDNYTITGANAGSLSFKAQFGGIDKTAFVGDQKARLAALEGGNVSSATLSYSNNGLFEKAVGFFAKAQKMTPDAIKQQWSALVTQILPALLGGDPSSLKLAAGVTKFIAAPKTLSISVRANGAPITFSDIMATAPAALLKKVTVDVTPQ
ncbi:MAG TPA: hypothetical protein VG271_08185 [Beijerinckiaceae bacterium]|nr:hypothetical protein [Beijerinckiaceae bacterium]